MIAFMLLVGACSEPVPIAEQYSGEWQQPTPNVIRALMHNGVTGCGEFYQKESTTHSSEFFVACPDDRGNWYSYLVWPNINSVQELGITAVWGIGGPPSDEFRGLE
jgi:hypothetical protein